MFFRGGFALLLALGYNALCQTPMVVPGQAAGTQPEKPKADCVLAGQVLNAVTGEPLRKASIQLHSQNQGQNPPREREVDAAGHFEFRDIEPGRYSLNASRTGFSSQAYGAKRPGGSGGTTITLIAAQTIKDLTFKLIPHAVIIGRVADDDGEPLANIEVSARRQEWQGRKRQWSMSGYASTNDLGEYRMFGVAPGNYVISAAKRRNFNWSALEPGVSGKPEEDLVTTYYPGAIDAALATRLTVRSGTETRGIDLKMLKSRVVRVRGTVIDGTTGRPARNSVALMTARGRGYGGILDLAQAMVRDQKGSFEFRGVAPGSYTVHVQSGMPGQQLAATAQVEVSDSDVNGLLLTLGAGTEMPGEVKIEGQSQGQSDSTGGQMMVYLAPWEDDSIMFGGGGTSAVKDDGSFTLKNVQPAKYRVTVSGLDGAYLKAARFGDADVLESGLDLSQGVTGGALRLVVSKSAAEVSGTVQGEDGKPLAGASVVLVPAEQYREQWGTYGTGSTDQYGVFKTRALRPGDYTIYAWEDLEGAEYMDPEFLKLFEKKGVKLTLKEGAKETQQLTAIPAEATRALRGQ